MQKPFLISVPVVSTVPPKVSWGFESYLYLELTIPQWAIIALLGNLFFLLCTLQTECPSIHPSAFRFQTLTSVVFDRFSSNFAWTLISGRRFGLQMGVICLLTTELWPLVDVKMFFLNIFKTNG